jgi:hypothetical protein
MKGLRHLSVLALGLTALLSGAAPALAQTPPWYEVELIVFRQPEPTGSDTELHPLDPPAPQASQVVSLRQPQAGTGQPYTMLGSGDLKLGSVYKSLQDSQRYEPLLHIGWRQPGLAGNQTASVALPPNWQPWADGARPPLYGLVRFQQDRFLHVAVDLRYYQPSSETVVTAGGGAASDAMPAPTYVHQQSRRIRTGELHYLDHPTLGVIVQVRPLAGS